MDERVERFLTQLRERVGAGDAGGSTAYPDAIEAGVREVDPGADLLTAFVKAAESTAATVDTCTDEDWVAGVLARLRKHEARSVVLPRGSDGFLTADRVAALREALDQAGIAAHAAPRDARLFAADAGITGATAAVAETGSVICSSSSQGGRADSLVPPVHVVILGVGQIVADLYDAFADEAHWRDNAANTTFITGPSKTADIEGVLIRGVHGPGHVHIVVVK